MREAYEAGDTVQFTWVSSIAPDSVPIVKITDIANAVTSLTSVESGASGYYYALYTMPNTAGVYMVEWYAQKTIVSSVYPFRKRELFNVVIPTREL